MLTFTVLSAGKPSIKACSKYWKLTLLTWMQKLMNKVVKETSFVGGITRLMWMYSVDVWKMSRESTITNKKIQWQSSKELQLQLMTKELQGKWFDYNWKS